MSADDASLASQGCMCSGAGENGDVATITVVDRYESRVLDLPQHFLIARSIIRAMFFSQIKLVYEFARCTVNIYFFSHLIVEIITIHFLSPILYFLH